MAWIHSSEKGSDSPRANLYEIEWPDLESGFLILDYLFEVGPTVAGGPLTFTEIESWQRQIGYMITAHQIGLIKKLSSQYYSKFNEYTGVLSQCPTRVIDYTDYHKQRLKNSFSK